MTTFNFTLLRGWIRDSRHWENFPEVMKEAFPSSFLHTPDNPGVGSKAQMKAPLSIHEMVNVLRPEYLSALTTERRVEGQSVLIGISMGGMIAYDWFRQHPQDFNFLVLINSSFSGLSPFYQRLHAKAYPSLIKISLEKDLTKREEKILALTSNNPKAPELYGQRWGDYQRVCPATWKTALTQLKAASSFRPVPLEIKENKILVLTSKADRLVSWKCSQEIARFLKAELVVHETAGHDLTLDQPWWIAEQIKNFIA